MMWTKGVSSLYQGVVEFKNYLYDKDYFHSQELPIPVLSLGNLTMGGTGKTPLTNYCLKYFQRKEVQAAVVSRNYKAQVRTATQVDLNHPHAAAYFGDEPVLLAKKNPQASFFVGPYKLETALYALKKIQPQLILVDDGFQHRQLHRDVDVIILDATEPMQNYLCVPAGRAREAWSSLERATAFVVSKVNLATEENLTALTEALAPFGKPTILAHYDLAKTYGIHSFQEKSLQEFRGRRTMLFSGIAKPESFQQGLGKFSLEVVRHVKYKDHHPYDVTDVQHLVKTWQAEGEPLLLTTEKDAVKLIPLWPREVPLWVAPLEVLINTQEDEFYEVLDQVLY